jgi:hypothetical protein
LLLATAVGVVLENPLLSRVSQSAELFEDEDELLISPSEQPGVVGVAHALLVSSHPDVRSMLPSDMLGVTEGISLALVGAPLSRKTLEELLPQLFPDSSPPSTLDPFSLFAPFARFPMGCAEESERKPMRIRVRE